MDHEQIVWDHFKFNADQRLKAFNCFLVLSIFADGVVLAALEKKLSPFLLLLLGLFLCVLSIVFWLADTRSKGLLRTSVRALRKIEKSFPPSSRLFRLDAGARNSTFRYTAAINILFALQLLFGLGVAAYGGGELYNAYNVSAEGANSTSKPTPLLGAV